LGDELARDFFSIPEDSGDGVGVIVCLEDQTFSSSDSAEPSARVLELVGQLPPRPSHEKATARPIARQCFLDT
jgi:hypothetical protein